jgi:hypothetical protein
MDYCQKHIGRKKTKTTNQFNLIYLPVPFSISDNDKVIRDNKQLRNQQFSN